MRRPLLKIAAAAILLFGVAAGVLYGALHLRDLKPVNTACRGPHTSAGSTELVVILGDSWASRGRLLPGFVDGFRRASNQPITVCSVSYPGRTASEIADGYAEDFPQGFGPLVGRNPDVLLILAGVNDVIGHAGSENYVAGLRDLAKIPAGRVFYSEIPTVAESKWEAPSLLSWGKNELFRIWHDQGQANVLAKYRGHARSLDLDVISFTPFAPTPTSVPLRNDGVHLTPEGDIRFGLYLGEAVASRTTGAEPTIEN